MYFITLLLQPTEAFVIVHLVLSEDPYTNTFNPSVIYGPDIVVDTNKKVDE